MNLLIVDDDAFVLEALTQKMQWEKLEIENVYTAYSVRMAKKILDEHEVHIIVCDIEMPKENGFKLLEWVREKELTIQFIFLTSYAEFEYARKAIELQSFAYVLKPVSYDQLAEQLNLAIEAEKKALALDDYKKVYENWTESENRRRDIFWNRYCVEDAFMNMEEVWDYINRMNLPYKKGDYYIPVLCNLGSYDTLKNELGRGMLEWTFQNIAEELFAGEHHYLAGTVCAEKRWLFILYVEDKKHYEDIYQCTGNLIFSTRQYLHSSLSCLLGHCVTLEEVPYVYMNMNRMFEKNVIEKSGIFEVNAANEMEEVYQPPDFAGWETLFRSDKEEELLCHVKNYMKSLSGKKYVSQRVIDSFVMDLIQMISVLLKEKQIMFHFVDETIDERPLARPVTTSLEAMERYVLTLIDKSMEAIRESRKNMSPVDYVRNYIEENLEKDITRESLAALVYLNPDYMARVFKKETGESINAFLIRKRMEKAKAMLGQTDASINEIAVCVGYDNFSYFSKVFKDVEGITPKEYRKKMTENK